MATYAFDSTTLPVVIEEYTDLPTALAARATFACAPSQHDALPTELRGVFVVMSDALPADRLEHLGQMLANVRPSRGDAPSDEPEGADDALDVELIAACVEHGHVLVCGRRKVAEVAWKSGVAVKNLREFLKAVDDPRYRFLDEQTGR